MLAKARAEADHKVYMTFMIAINKGDQTEISPFITEAQNNDEFDITHQGSTGCSALNTAITKGDLATVKALIEIAESRDWTEGQWYTFLNAPLCDGKTVGEIASKKDDELIDLLSKTAKKHLTQEHISRFLADISPVSKKFNQL